MQWAELVSLGLALPCVEESTAYGRPALKVGGKAFCSWNNPEDVVFQLANVDEQEVLIAAAPKIYYITPHYVGWPAVRARLRALGKRECKLRLERAWLAKAPPKILRALSAEGALPAFAAAQAAAHTAPKRAAKSTPARGRKPPDR